MKAVIVEDEILSANRLKKLLSAEELNIEVVAVLNSVQESLAWFEGNKNPDLIFLDIQLTDGTGFDIINNLTDFPQIIFTTAFEQYALEAFKFNSVDYLLKPIDEKELRNAIHRLEEIKKLEQAGYQEKLKSLGQSFMPEFRERFLVKYGQQFKSIGTNEIAYFYHADGMTYLKTIDTTLPIDYSLDHLEQEIDPKHFFRISRQYIVSMSAVKEIHSYFNSRLLLTLEPNTTSDVIVSRDRVLKFKVWAGM